MTQTAPRTDPADLVRHELAQVEAILRDSCRSEVELLQEAAHHTVSAGGKRLRPQLALLSAAAAGAHNGRAVGVAAACELIHTATLVHDDVVDESDSRRGRESARFHYGNPASVLMGDFLVVRAFRIVAGEPDRRLWTLLAETIARMCEGEVLQLCTRGDTSAGESVYDTIIECKTAVLMSLCCRLGCLVAGRDPACVERLADFGYHVGMAFQIQDDILDFLGDETVLGKPVGGDFREGKVTLPLIYALEHAAPEDRELLQQLCAKSSALTRDDVDRATRIIEAAGGFDRARERARQLVEEARRDLETVPPGPARDGLVALSEQVVERIH